MSPKIICHMVSSVDGRLLPDRWTSPAAGTADGLITRVYEQVASRFDADGFLVGRKTMEEFSGVTVHAPMTYSAEPRSDHIAASDAGRIAIVIDPRGKLHYARPDADGDHLVTVLAQTVSDAYLAKLREVGVSYIFAGRDGHDLPAAMEKIGSAFGSHTILLEGGGLINGAFLKAGLVDELSLIVYPGIDGLAGVPTIFEWIGEPDERPAMGRCLRHLHTETLEAGMVWIHYRFEDAALAAN